MASQRFRLARTLWSASLRAPGNPGPPLPRPRSQSSRSASLQSSARSTSGVAFEGDQKESDPFVFHLLLEDGSDASDLSDPARARSRRGSSSGLGDMESKRTGLSEKSPEECPNDGAPRRGSEGKSGREKRSYILAEVSSRTSAGESPGRLESRNETYQGMALLGPGPDPRPDDLRRLAAECRGRQEEPTALRIRPAELRGRDGQAWPVERGPVPLSSRPTRSPRTTRRPLNNLAVAYEAVGRFNDRTHLLQEGASGISDPPRI